MTDEEIKLKRLRYAIEEDMTENELFEIARERRYRINDLEKENKEILEDNDTLNKWIDELKEQIEKMKNFYNCSHSSRALCPNEHKCNGCKDWELAE